MISFALLQVHARGWLDWPRWATPAPAAARTTQTVANTQAEIQCHHLAWHRAYERFAQRHPQWVQRRFDAEFLRRMTQRPALPTGLELAAAWDRQFGPLFSDSERLRQMTELTTVANQFVAIYQQEYQQLTALALPRI